MISSLISYIDLILKRVKTEELNTKNKIIKFLNIIRISYRSRVIGSGLGNLRKKPD